MTDVEGATAFISYRELAGRILDLDHTFVPTARFAAAELRHS